jgi:hypothetical protein
MRFMILRKADRNTEAGALPNQELLAAMGQYMEDMARAGILLAGEGLRPTSEGVRVKFSRGKPHRDRRTVRGGEGIDRRLEHHPGELDGRGDRMGEALAQDRR